MRGANCRQNRQRHTEDGASPHAWGKRAHLAAGNLVAVRFIPTCVGQTLPRAGYCPRCTVHPHMRGANTLLSCPPGRTAGSSPHAWGKRVTSHTFRLTIPVHPHMRGANVRLLLRGLCAIRFIPTCVGQTLVGNSYFRRRNGSSPHAWGKRIPFRRISFSSSGSSPHAWGKLYRSKTPPARCRFIPTCVGQT